MNLQEVLELVERVWSEIPNELRGMFYEGLKRAYERGDMALLYHYVSMLSQDYYGIDLPYSFDSYYKSYPEAVKVQLPKHLERTGADTLESIRSRRSRRSYSAKPLTLNEVSTLLYHAVGITERSWWGGLKRVYPSAGALQPVEAYIVAAKVENLQPGLYHYNPGEHSLELLMSGDQSRDLEFIALGQEHVGGAPANLILTLVYKRTASKYGLRAYRYAHLDAGFAAQNVYLVAEALNLATVAVGAFYDRELCEMLRLNCEEEMPVLILPLGRKS